MGSETLPSASSILSDGSSIPFYSTSNGYKNKNPTDSVLIYIVNKLCYVSFYTQAAH